tara:strand:- start:100 stop:582 length:483 start_codon:yes stop_codon:yes gene_type:complete
VNDKDNIILFPTNRIKNHEQVKHPVDPKEHSRLVEEQTKEFVEGNVDDIAYQLLDKFVKMGIRTNQMTFTADLALVIDTIRGLVYRDFNKKHPAQQLTDKMVTLNSSGKNKSARLDYSKVLDTKHKPHKPLSRDIEDEVRDLSDMADVHFTPDFEPDNDK